MARPVLDYGRRGDAGPLLPRRTLASASLVLVAAANCGAGVVYFLAIVVREGWLVAGVLGFLTTVAWLTGTSFAAIALVDRDGPRRVALLTLLICAADVAGAVVLYWV